MIFILNQLWTAAEIKIGLFFGALWSLIDMSTGGIDTPIKALAILIVIDFITGVTAGYKKKELSSATGYRGLCKKAGIFLCIMFAYILDLAMGVGLFRGFVIAGFAVIEAISIIENIDRLGWGFIIPAFLRLRLEQIADEKKVRGK